MSKKRTSRAVMLSLSPPVYAALAELAKSRGLAVATLGRDIITERLLADRAPQEPKP